MPARRDGEPVRGETEPWRRGRRVSSSRQLDFLADRTSRHEWWPNQFRPIVASLAYTRVEARRRLAPKGTHMARAQGGTIRLKLPRIAAVVPRNTRRVRLHPTSRCPEKALFGLAARRLEPP